MIWILLYQLIFGGSSNPLMFAKFEKHAKHIIQNEQRLDQVLAYQKETKSNSKDFAKAEKVYNKTIYQLEKDKNSSRDQINVIINEYLNDKKTELLNEVDLFIKTKDQIQEEEWNQIIKESVKGFEKYNKFQQKQVAKNNQYWLKLKKKFNSDDEDIKNKVESIIEAYNNYNDIIMSLKSPSNTKLTDYNSTKDELTAMVDQVIIAQRKLFDVRLDLRDLIYNNPDKFKVNKAMKKLKKVTH
nr:hypothetical protein [uncultured Carboxylicivirga sp.]